MSIELLATFIAACIAIVIVPGPTVTVIIANSLRDGPKAGLMNVAGTQVGLLVMLIVLATGLEFIVTQMAAVFEWVRLLGAAYLIWLGIKLLRSNGDLGNAGERSRPGGSYFWQGVLVIWSNPKALFFFGAFIPQFIDPNGNAVIQTLVLGGIFMAVATILDGCYALAAGKAGNWLSRTRVRLLEGVSGVCLIAGGVWLAMARR